MSLLADLGEEVTTVLSSDVSIRRRFTLREDPGTERERRGDPDGESSSLILLRLGVSMLYRC